MNFTREDLQRIAKGLKQLSIKDTQFANAKALTTETKFPVVQGNVNVLLTSAQLLNFLVSNLDANSLKVNVPNWTSGTLSSLLGRLYTLASSRNNYGNPITAESVEYGNNIDEEITSVANALDYIIDELVDKIDAIEIAGEPHVDPTQMPIITLSNIVPTDTCPITAGSGMWFDDNHVLQYRNGNAIPAVDIEIGTPVDMLYLYNGDAYHYNTTNGVFEKVGDIDLSNYVQLNSDTGKIDHSVLSQFCLVKMVVPPASYQNSNRNYYYYNPSTKKIIYVPSTGSSVSIDPVPGIVYLDLNTRNWYVWDATEQAMKVVKNSAELDGTGRLSVSQWPQTLLYQVTPVTENVALATMGEGYLFVMEDSTESQIIGTIDNGRVKTIYPSDSVVYFAQTERAFYSYNGTQFQKISIDGNIGSSSNYATLDGSNLLEGYQAHILPLASMGFVLDNIDLAETGGAPFYYDDNKTDGEYWYDPESGAIFRRENGSDINSSFILQNPLVINLHTGRVYHAVEDQSSSIGYSYVEFRIKSVEAKFALDDAGLIPYNWIPRTVFEEMGRDPNITLGTPGCSYYYTNKKIRHYYAKNTGQQMRIMYVEYDPVPGLLYANKADGYVYMWDSGAKIFVKTNANSVNPNTPSDSSSKDCNCIYLDDVNMRVVHVVDRNYNSPVLFSPGTENAPMIIKSPATYADLLINGTALTGSVNVLASGEFSVQRVIDNEVSGNAATSLTLYADEVNNSDGTTIRVRCTHQGVVLKSSINGSITVSSDSDEFSDRHVAVKYYTGVESNAGDNPTQTGGDSGIDDKDNIGN